MIKFIEAINLMRENELSCVKVIGLDKKRICEFVDNDSVEAAVKYLEDKQSMLASYGRVNIFACTLSNTKQNWVNKFEWLVQCDSNIPVTYSGQENTTQIKGFVSQREAELMAKVESMQIQMMMQKQIDEINRKLEGKEGKDPSDYLMKLLPIAPFFTNDMTKISKSIELAGAMAGMNVQQKGIAGGNNSVIQNQMTEAEVQTKLDDLNAKIIALIKHPDVGLEKLAKIIDAASKDPSLINKVIVFI